MDAKSILNTETLGTSLRIARIEAGYQRAMDLAEAITELTGYKVAESTIYKIENGLQEPKLSLYLAMMRVLFPDDGIEISGIIRKALPDLWDKPLNKEEKKWTLSFELDEEDSGKVSKVVDLLQKLINEFSDSSYSISRLLSADEVLIQVESFNQEAGTVSGRLESPYAQESELFTWSCIEDAGASIDSFVSKNQHALPPGEKAKLMNRTKVFF